MVAKDLLSREDARGKDFPAKSLRKNNSSLLENEYLVERTLRENGRVELWIQLLNSLKCCIYTQKSTHSHHEKDEVWGTERWWFDGEGKEVSWWSDSGKVGR